MRSIYFIGNSEANISELMKNIFPIDTVCKGKGRHTDDVNNYASEKETH